MTPKGYNALRRELKRLKAQRPEISHAIEVARAHGDISENADYEAAKNKSGMVEARIRDIEAKLAQAEIIDPSKVASLERVVFGLSVKVADVESAEERIFTVVGTDESDAERGLVSYEAPIGRALIGRQVGDVAKVQLPAGRREFEILDIFCDYQPETNGEAE